jgi:hypothetical protein
MAGGMPCLLIANSPELLLRLARRGSGIVSAQMDSPLTCVRSGELVGVLPDWALPKVTVWAVFHGRRLVPAKTRAFIVMLRAVLGRRIQFAFDRYPCEPGLMDFSVSTYPLNLPYEHSHHAGL